MTASLWAYRGWILAGSAALITGMAWQLHRWDQADKRTRQREAILRAARYRPDYDAADVYAIGTYRCPKCGFTLSLDASFPGVTIAGECRCLTRFEVAPAATKDSRP